MFFAMLHFRFCFSERGRSTLRFTELKMSFLPLVMLQVCKNWYLHTDCMHQTRWQDPPTIVLLVGITIGLLWFHFKRKKDVWVEKSK